MSECLCPVEGPGNEAACEAGDDVCDCACHDVGAVTTCAPCPRCGSTGEHPLCDAARRERATADFTCDACVAPITIDPAGPSGQITNRCGTCLDRAFANAVAHGVRARALELEGYATLRCLRCSRPVEEVLNWGVVDPMRALVVVARCHGERVECVIDLAHLSPKV